jgi:hypothetical protein
MYFHWANQIMDFTGEVKSNIVFVSNYPLCLFGLSLWERLGVMVQWSRQGSFVGLASKLGSSLIKEVKAFVVRGWSLLMASQRRLSRPRAQIEIPTTTHLNCKVAIQKTWNTQNSISPELYCTEIQNSYFENNEVGSKSQIWDNC